MINDYFPILIQLGAGLCVALGAIVISLLLGKRSKTSAAKDASYECGKDPVGPVMPRFSVKFYLVAMIFILFDIEVIFMYPWAVNFLNFNAHGLGPQIFSLMLAFVLVVEAGHFYAYKHGVFDWNKRG